LATFLAVYDLSKQYGTTLALDRVNLSVNRGEILAILGPSGCGKSTLLRLIAGLEQPTSGRIVCDGVDLAGVPPHRRGFGLMFQDYALFPHLNVAANIAFGLKVQGRLQAPRFRLHVGRWSIPANTQSPLPDTRLRDLLRLVNLEGYEQRPVHTLSGGEQQRVALARSLAPAPRLLMLDEPLGALDAVLRQELLAELGQILGKTKANSSALVETPGRRVDPIGTTTFIYVTHDQEEALTIADRVALMRAGRIIQVDTPAGLVNRPASAFVANFLSLGAIVPGVARRSHGDWEIETGLGRFRVAGEQPVTAGPACLLIRPGAIQTTQIHEPIPDTPPPIQPSPHLSTSNQVAAIVIGQTIHPEGLRLRLRLTGRGSEGVESVARCAEPVLSDPMLTGRGSEGVELVCPWPGSAPATGQAIIVSLDPSRLSLVPL